MTNKVLVSVLVPSLEKSYDVYLPINKRVHNCITMLKKTMFDLSGGTFVSNDSMALYNADTGVIYDMNAFIRNTDIRNDSKVILL